MEQTKPARKQSYKQLEKLLTTAVLAGLFLFVLMMVASHCAVIWLKVILGILTMALSAAGCGFLVLIGEHKRQRSLWVLTAFVSLFLCALVSLITGSPA